MGGTGAGSIATTYYYAENFLGSSRAMVQSGATTPCFDADFLPFGREKDNIAICTQNDYKFEGKERDAETGNDDFGARYYSSNFGRWLSPDWSSVPSPVPYANLANPQTLNLYAMVEDDPESFADLDGHVNTPGTASQTGTCNVESWDGCDDLGQSRAWALHESAAGYTWQQIADIINGEAPAGAAYALTFTPRNISIPACLKDVVKCQDAAKDPQQASALVMVFPAVASAAPKLLPYLIEASAIARSASGWAAVLQFFLLPPSVSGKGEDFSAAQLKAMSIANPLQGPPGGTSQIDQPDGTPKQVRRYGADGFPETDVDFYDHGRHDPHAHDWSRPEDGSNPTDANRGERRDLKPTDPQPQ